VVFDRENDKSSTNLMFDFDYEEEDEDGIKRKISQIVSVTWQLIDDDSKPKKNWEFIDPIYHHHQCFDFQSRIIDFELSECDNGKLIGVVCAKSKKEYGKS